MILNVFEHRATNQITENGTQKLEIVLYTLFVLSCPNKLTGMYRTVPIFVPSLHVFSNQTGATDKYKIRVQNVNRIQFQCKVYHPTLLIYT